MSFQLLAQRFYCDDRRNIRFWASIMEAVCLRMPAEETQCCLDPVLMKAQAQQIADDHLTYWKPRCREREGVWPRFIHSQPGTVMQRTCSRMFSVFVRA